MVVPQASSGQRAGRKRGDSHLQHGRDIGGGCGGGGGGCGRRWRLELLLEHGLGVVERDVVMREDHELRSRVGLRRHSQRHVS